MAFNYETNSPKLQIMQWFKILFESPNFLALCWVIRQQMCRKIKQLHWRKLLSVTCGISQATLTCWQAKSVHNETTIWRFSAPQTKLGRDEYRENKQQKVSYFFLSFLFYQLNLTLTRGFLRASDTTVKLLFALHSVLTWYFFPFT